MQKVERGKNGVKVATWEKKHERSNVEEATPEEW